MLFFIYVAFNIAIAAFIAFLSFKNLMLKGGKSILALSIALLLCYISNLQYILFPSSQTETIHTTIMFLGKTFVSIAVIAFSLEYTQRPKRFSKYTLFFLAIVPFLTLILLAPSELIWFVQERIPLLASLEISLVEKVNALYRYSLLIIAIWLLGRIRLLRSNISPFWFGVMLAGPLAALVTQSLVLLGFYWVWLDEIFLLSINLSALMFAYFSFKPNLYKGLVVRRGDLIENMEDGWIILDTQNSVIDFNRATTKILGLPRKKIYGKPIVSILKDIPALENSLYQGDNFEMDRTVTVNGEYRYFNIRVISVQDEMNMMIGRLILWRDVTDHKRVEDARQQARDEMFVLLNAISNAAIQTTNLKEFLLDALYQIIYPFRSQIMFVCVSDERLHKENERESFLAANLGLSVEVSKELNKVCSSFTLYDLFNENKSYLLMENPNDPYFPEPLKPLDLICLLVFPLVVRAEGEKKLIGLFFLGRKDGSSYKQDEITRLSILADQLATLIDSDRRRKLAIAFSERQRLMRDIHDSVSQKLYGLVTLTEAAQATLEAGNQLDYSQFLSRIGENARQAVKELRLFLFQMLPVDLEKEGLISVLHHRLAAVEGRADIKVRFLADEITSLSKRKEVALYYIAQEALNNVLRHAHASSVSVTLKQGYKYVTLEVKDDGRGFDSISLDRGGMGLKNITERVKQENGKLKISSKPGKGTVVKVTFDVDSSVKSD